MLPSRRSVSPWSLPLGKFFNGHFTLGNPVTFWLHFGDEMTPHSGLPPGGGDDKHMFSSLWFSGVQILRMPMAPKMVATLSRGVTFSRLLRPHPRVLGISVCASTRCSLAGLSSGLLRGALIARLLCSENNCSSYLLSLSYPFDSFNY